MKRTHAGAAGSGVGRRPAAPALVVVAVVGVVAGSAGLAGCGGTPSTANGPLPGASAFSPATASVSGTGPSAPASVSSAASSASAAASSFAASVSTAAAQSRAAAQAALAPVSGPGNATADVTVTGVPRSTSGGLNAAMVTITNSSASKASYAVRVDFDDASGKALDSTVVGVESLDPGATASPIAFSSLASDLALTPRVVQAQRY